MPGLFTLVFFLFLPFIIFCQQVKYEIRGKIERITNSKNIYLTSGITEGKIDTAHIDEKGMFSFKGNLPEAQEATLRIDSTSSVFFWIDSGVIEIEMKESKYADKFNNLYVTNLIGPEDCYLYYYKNIFSRRSSYIILPEQIDEKAFRESNPALPTHLMVVRSKEEFKRRNDSVTYYLIDSIMRVRPTSKVLPHYIRFYSSTIGPEMTGHFYSRLPEELRNSEDGKGIVEYLNQQSALQTGSVLENFTMNNSDGRLFNLDDVKARFILLDFWASWCGPCRANHPFLREANEKYKNKGLKIISISLDDDKESWLEGINTDKLNWINISDLQEFEGAFAKRCKIFKIPFSILLDKNKKILYLDLTGQELLDKLENVLKK